MPRLSQSVTPAFCLGSWYNDPIETSTEEHETPDPHYPHCDCDPAFTAENQAVLNVIRGIRQSVYEEFFFNLPIVQGVLTDIDNHRQDGIRERDSRVDIDGAEYEVLKKIDVLWSGWECDGTAWLVQSPDGPKIVMSDHGQKHFDNGDELRARIFAYQEAIRETEELLKMAQQ